MCKGKGNLFASVDHEADYRKAIDSRISKSDPSKVIIGLSYRFNPLFLMFVPVAIYPLTIISAN